MFLARTGYSSISENAAAVDVDGVLLDFDRAFATVGSSALGRPLIKRNTSYYLAERYGLGPAEVSRVWAAMDDHPMGWQGMPLLPGAANAMSRLKRLGLNLHIVTGINERLVQTRLANLLAHSIEVDSIDCVGEGHQSKVASLLKYRPIMFVDDRLRLLEEADFVPYRVWVDHGDTQDGHVVHEDIIHVRNLETWVNQFESIHSSLSRNRAPPRRPVAVRI